MFSLKKKQSGFTIVELLIVIVVIGILATLVIVTFTGIQKKARDSQRQTDINAANSQISAFYTSYGFYPNRADLLSSSFRSTYLKGLDPESLKDPKGGDIQATSDATHYGYSATNSSGGTCATVATTIPTDPTTPPADNGCDTYTITATLESGGTFSKNSN